MIQNGSYRLLGAIFPNGEVHHGGLKGHSHSLDSNEPLCSASFSAIPRICPSGRVNQPVAPAETGFCSAELTRFSTGTSVESSALADVPEYQFVDNLRPPCSQCGRPLILTCIAPEEPGFDLRTYFCAACYVSETVIAPVARKLGPEI
jgi:hypothetical protein